MRHLPFASAVTVILAVVLASGCTARPPGPATMTDLRPFTSQTSWNACGKCHTDVYSEWKHTLHAQAWVDPIFRMSAGNPPKTECRGCHSMEPILAGEISVEYEWRPVFRDYNHEDGVGCVSCHMRADGTVAAREDHPTAPCKPRRDARITTPEYCGACHNPSHDAFFEWKQSTYSKNGVSCSDCHSFPVLRTAADGTKRIGYSHAAPGGNSPEFVRRAIHTETRLEGREVVMTVKNLTGHKFPGEVPSRTFLIRIAPYDADGNPLEELYQSFKRPFKTQTGVPDNRLKPDETRVLRQALPVGAKGVRVSYVFKPSPLMMEKGWTVMDTWESEIK